MTGAEIAALRERELHMTQAQLAQVLGVHVLTVSKWERNVLAPTPHQVALLQTFARGAERRPNVGEFVVGALVGAGVSLALYTILQAAFGDDVAPTEPRRKKAKRKAARRRSS